MSDTLENTINTEGVLTAQVNLYLFLALAFSLPGKMKSAYPEQLAGLIPELPVTQQEPVRILVQEWEESSKDSEALALAYSRLFLGPFEIFSSPYASFYLEPEQRVMGDVSQWVASCYAEAGLEPGKGIREVPDHIALECEFMYYMLFQSITEDHQELNDQIQRFQDHLQQWIPPFAKAVRKAEQHPFYAAAVDVLENLTVSESV